MVPDADLQLQVVIKALEEVVAPAVDPTNKVAAEQLHLGVATLKMLRGQLPMARRYTRMLLQHALALAKELPEGSGGAEAAALADAMGAARAVLADPAAEIASIEAARAELTERSVSLINAADGGARGRIDSLVLDHSKAVIELSRAWVVGSGFEPDSSAIPTISELLR